MSKNVIILILFNSFSANLIGQEVSLTGGFLPYETYYIGSIDMSTGKSDVQLFNFMLSSPSTPVPYEPAIEFNVKFMIAKSMLVIIISGIHITKVLLRFHMNDNV